MRKLTITQEDHEKAIRWKQEYTKTSADPEWPGYKNGWCANCPVSQAVRREWKIKPWAGPLNGRLTPYGAPRQYYTADPVVHNVINLFDRGEDEKLRQLLPVTITAYVAK